MGYGKTMGMRSYLKGRTLPYVWQSAMDPSPDYFWRQFCRSFSQIDAEIAQELEAVGFPNDNVLACTAAHLMSNASIGQETLVIIDDYHLIFSRKMNRFSRWWPGRIFRGFTSYSSAETGLTAAGRS